MYCALYTDPGVMAHIVAPLSPEAARTDFETSRRLNAESGGAACRWAVLDRVSAARLGLLAMLRDGKDPGNAEIGLMLLPGAQGRWFAREIIRAVVAHAFRSGGWGLRRVWARHAAGNAAAANVLHACGFAPGPRVGGNASAAITREAWRALNP